jgi:hypothetical protein
VAVRLGTYKSLAILPMPQVMSGGWGTTTRMKKEEENKEMKKSKDASWSAKMGTGTSVTAFRMIVSITRQG